MEESLVGKRFAHQLFTDLRESRLLSDSHRDSRDSRPILAAIPFFGRSIRKRKVFSKRESIRTNRPTKPLGNTCLWQQHLTGKQLLHGEKGKKTAKTHPESAFGWVLIGWVLGRSLKVFQICRKAFQPEFGSYRGLARVLKSPSNPQNCRKKEKILEKGTFIFCAKPWYAPNPRSKEL